MEIQMAECLVGWKVERMVLRTVERMDISWVD
jgi:hypothetical protein